MWAKYIRLPSFAQIYPRGAPKPPKRAGLFHSKKEKSGSFEISFYFDSIFVIN
jgi:hypothetical protein